jgi:hypothetical protein
MDVRGHAAPRVHPRLDHEHVRGWMMELVTLLQNRILDHT